MEDEIKLLKEICGKLEDSGIEYMITGSIALAFYSTPRMTRDIDIIIKVLPSDLQKIISLFRDDFYISETAVKEALVNSSMFNVIHNETIMKIDFIVRKNNEYRIKEFSRRQKIALAGTLISVVSPEDLVLSKLDWAKQSKSEMQLRDVRNIFAMARNIDYDYIREWSQKLKLEEILQEVTKNE
jgi:hypothetical protein